MEVENADYEALNEVPNEKHAGEGAEEILTTVANGGTVDNGMTAIEYLEEENEGLESENCEDLPGNKEKATNSRVEEENGEEEEEEENEGEGEIEELEEVDEGDEPDEEGETPVEKKPTQVPKKRKDAAMLAAAGEEEYVNNTDEPEDEAARAVGRPRKDDQPSSSKNVRPNKENTVDEEQCRVCTTKKDLVSIFKKVDKSTVADLLMAICPSVSIARKDFMPQYICNTCVDNVNIAVQLKTQCENTERELRKKLSRHKNKVRRPTGYVVIDAPVESDPPSDEEPNDDVEFKVSDVEDSISADDDSDDSDFNAKKKRVSRGGGGGGKRGRRKSAPVAPTPTPKRRPGRPPGRPSLKRPPPPPIDADSSDEEEEVPIRSAYGSQKKKQSKKDSESEQATEYACDQCDQVYTRKLSLVLHKKAHSGERQPINCEVCGKQFKIAGAYRTHLERHKDEVPRHSCSKCDKAFPSKAELRHHLAEQHDEQGMVLICNKCKRTFVSEVRLARHQDGHCPGFQMKQKPKSSLDGYTVGKDLFKSVAPMTTTYWSDSFSD